LDKSFFNSNPIIAGKKYTFSAYIRIPNHLTTNIQGINTSTGIFYPDNLSQIADLNYNLESVFSLNVYLSTQEIKYSNTLPTCNSATWHDNFKDLSFNSIVQIKNFQISPRNYTYGEWHRISFEFICPSNKQYDWIGIEQDHDSNNQANIGYILIDDVSLIESC